MESASSLQTTRPTGHVAGQPDAGVKSEKLNTQGRLALIEQGFCIFSFLFFANGITTILNDNETLMRPLRYGIFLFAVLLLVARWQGTLRAIAKGWLLWPLIGLMVVSQTWSISPVYTMESIRGEVLPMTAFALYFASRFNPKEQLRILAMTLGLGAFLSLVYAIALPSVGRHIGDKFDGAWRGIYSQKNNFSTMMTLTMLIFFVMSLVNKPGKERVLSMVGLAASIAMIILSTSRSGLMIFFVMLIVVSLARLFRWKGRRSVLILDLAGLGLICATAGLAATWQDIVIGLGRDPTLSARTFIWSGSIDKIMDRPLLGYGRAAFWVGDSRPAWEVGALTGSNGFVPAHAHNGFIDVALDIGLLGLGLFLLGLLLTFGIALRRAYRAQQPENLWPFAFLSLMTMSNMTETVLMNRTTLYWVLYVIVFLSLRLWRPLYVEPDEGAIEPGESADERRENGTFPQLSGS